MQSEVSVMKERSRKLATTNFLLSEKDMLQLVIMSKMMRKMLPIQNRNRIARSVEREREISKLRGLKKHINDAQNACI